MNYYAVRLGHQATGEDGGAVGIISELDVTRGYGPYVINGISDLGEKAINVTPSESYRTLIDSLFYGINLANQHGVDIFVSCHANHSENEQAHGCEVIYCSEGGKVLAERICCEIASLGFYNRGAKEDERGLAELHRTNGIAVIIEPFFVSNQDDVDLYNKIGPQKLGYAIIKGLTGIDLNIKKGECSKVKNIIICNDGTDEKAAKYLADYLHCPIVTKENLTKDIVEGSENIFVVGGIWKPTENSILITGQDRFKTMESVLNYIKR